MTLDTKFKLFLSISKNPLEPDLSVTLTGSTPEELTTAMETIGSIAKTTALYRNQGGRNDSYEPDGTGDTRQAAEAKTEQEEKPVGAKGLMFLRCPNCNDEFPIFSRERKTVHGCKKCGTEIPLESLRRFEFTCPDCGNTSYGRTNIMDAEIIDPEINCVCGRRFNKFVWNVKRNCYTTEE